MSRVSRRVGAITESATLAVDAKAKALQAAGEDVIGFGAGEPDFPTPRAHRRGGGRGVPRPSQPPLHARRRAARAARRHRGQDRPRLGLRRRAAQVARHERRQARGLQHVPDAARPRRRSAAAGAVLDDVPGGHRARRRCVRGRCPPPEARVPGHGRPARSRLDARARRRCCSCRRATRPARCTRRPRSRRSAAGPSSTASGSSPTRSTSTSRTATTGSRRCRRSFPSSPTRCVVLNGVAKTYAMTGWRVGWMIGPRDVIAAATNLQSHSTSNVANVSQRGRARRGERRPRSRRRRCAPRSSVAGGVMHELLAGDPGCHVPRAAGRVLLLPVVRRRARPRDRRPHAARHVSSCASSCSTRPRSRSCPARRSARRVTRVCRSRSATTTSARACERIAKLLARDPAGNRAGAERTGV